MKKQVTQEKSNLSDQIFKEIREEEKVSGDESIKLKLNNANKNIDSLGLAWIMEGTRDPHFGKKRKKRKKNASRIENCNW